MNNAAESRNQSNKEEVMNKWDPEKLQEFIENIETVKVIDLENKLINSNNDSVSSLLTSMYMTYQKYLQTRPRKLWVHVLQKTLSNK